MPITLKPTVASRRSRLLHIRKVRDRGEVVTFRGQQEMAFVFPVSRVLAGTAVLSHADRGALIASAHPLAFEFLPKRWAPYSSDPVPAPGEYVFRRDGTEPHLLTDDKIPGQRDINTSVTVIGYRDIFYKPATGTTTEGPNTMAGIVHKWGRTFNAGGVSRTVPDYSITGDSNADKSVDVPNGTVKTALGWAFTLLNVRSIFILPSVNMTLITNNATTPQDTIALVAGKSVEWNINFPTSQPIPFAGNVTEGYISNASGADGTLEIWVALNNSSLQP